MLTSFKHYYDALLRGHLGGGPSADEAMRDYREAVLHTWTTHII